MQRSTAGAHVRRARFHSSMIDTRMLRRNQKFKELKDSYVIFITQNDIFKKGKSVYNIERIIRETEEDFTDGSHIRRRRKKRNVRSSRELWNQKRTDW